MCDFREHPRPHFCMGLILEGKASFTFEGQEEAVQVGPGDIIFVPISSRYISVWEGSPDILYISMHFAFSPESKIADGSLYYGQMVTVSDVQKTKLLYEKAFSLHEGNASDQFTALGAFFSVFGDVFPALKKKSTTEYDNRIKKAVDYINLNAEKEIYVPFLAELCHMSTSGFYSSFKQEMGVTPVEYKNRILIDRSTRLLLYDREKSIEDISEALGFYSSTYFRRVFKKITGMTPGRYRKGSAEL